MAFEALINSITLACLVLLGLWIVAHVAQAVELLVMYSAYRRHSKNIFTIPFVPLQTRLFHELAVPQFLASEAIQRGEVPCKQRATSAGAAEDVHPGVAPSTTLPTLSSAPPSSIGSVLLGSPVSPLSDTDDSKNLKQNATRTAVPQKGGTCDGHVEADLPVEVPVHLQPTPLNSATRTITADATNLSWWSPKLEGQDLVLGLRLPLQLQSAASHSLAVRLEKKMRGATAPASRADRGSFSNSPTSTLPNRRSDGGGVSGGGGGGPNAGGLSATSNQLRQPSVSLQLRQYRLTSVAPLSLTIKSLNADSPCSATSALRHASRLDTRQRHSGPYSSLFRRIEPAYADERVFTEQQTAIAAQLVTAPMQVSTRLAVSASVPRLLCSASVVQHPRMAAVAAGAVDFDAIKYAYIRHNQRLLEVAVAEQTAMAHRGRHDRKSAKHAQRIAAVLMQYLQYTHEDDDEDIVDDDFTAEEHGRGNEGDSARCSPDTSASQNSSGFESGSSSEVHRFRGTAAAAAAAGTSSGTASSSATTVAVTLTRRRRNQLPWVPLLGDGGGGESGKGRHIEPFPATTSPGGVSPSPWRLPESRSQSTTTTAPQSLCVPGKRNKNKAKRPKVGETSPVVGGPAASAAAAAAVIAPPSPVHESRRSTRKRREAAADIADTAVDALEALVERVRQAQTLRPRYRTLLCAVNFRAERFIVRRGASGSPTWTALSTSCSSAKRANAPEQPTSRGGVAGGSRLPNSLTLCGGGSYHLKGSNGQSRRGSNSTWVSSSGVFDFNHSDSATGVSASGEFARESSFASVADGRAVQNRKGGGKASPPSPDESTSLPMRRCLSADSANAAAAVDEDAVSALTMSLSSRTSDQEARPASTAPSALQTLPRPSSTLSAEVVKPILPNINVGSTASITPLGSTSANDAAMEFLRASRRLKKDSDSPQFSADFSRTSSVTRPSQYDTQLGENGEEGAGDTWSSPLSKGHQRRSSESANGSGADPTEHSGHSHSLRHDASSVYSDRDAQRAHSPRHKSPNDDAPRVVPAVSPSESKDVAAETATTPSAAPVPRGPRECDLRMVYLIGADRATLLRSLTLHATQAFSAGAQNFLCFFTHKDEQRARRRYLEEMDCQRRMELQRRLEERTSVTVAGQDGALPHPSLVDDNHSDSDFGETALRSFRIQSPPAAVASLSRTTSRLSSSGPLRHTRMTSWHTVGPGGSGVFRANSSDFHTAATEYRETHGFETAASVPSSMQSPDTSFASLPPRRESAAATAVEAPLGDSGSITGMEREVGNRLDQSSNATVQRTPAAQTAEATKDDEEGEPQLRSLDSTDNVFAHSLHSIDSVTQHFPERGASVTDTPTHPMLKVEVSATAPLNPRNNATATPEIPAAEVRVAEAVVASQPLLANSKAAAQIKENEEESKKTPVVVANKGQRSSKKDIKKLTTATMESADTKRKSKKSLKAAAAAAAAAQPASPARSSPTLELPDTIGDHDVRRYHAAIGVTLPEQVFLLRDTHGEGDAPLPGNQNSAHGGVMERVLEGQVEVAELSLDVLSRQLGPFMPQREPSAGTRSNFADDDEASDAVSSIESSSDDDFSSATRSSFATDDDGDDDVDDDSIYQHGSKRGRQQRHSSRKWGSRMSRRGTDEERDTRQSSRNGQGDHSEQRAAGRSTSRQRTRKEKTAASRREARSSAAAASRAKRRRRRQRRLAVWRRRIVCKQAAVTRAGISPVSVAVLFFTAPPQLPMELLLRLQAQHTTYEQAALPIPAWAQGSVAVSGTPRGAAPRQTVENSTDEQPFSSSSSQPQQQQQQQQMTPAPPPLASVCVTLIYTSTAEQVARTLLLANEMATSVRLTKRAESQASSYSLDNSFVSNHLFQRSGTGQQRSSWADKLWERSSHSQRRFSSSTNCRNSNDHDDDTATVRRMTSLMNTNPPSPSDSLHTRGRMRGTDSFPSSLAVQPPPPPPPPFDVGTATFAGDESSLLSSDEPTAAATHMKRDDSDTAVRRGSNSPAREVEKNAAADNGDVGGGGAAAMMAGEKSPPLPPLLLLTESSDSVASGEGDYYASPAHARSKTAEGLDRMPTSVFVDSSGSLDARRAVKEDSLRVDDDSVPAAARAIAHSIGDDDGDNNTGNEQDEELNPATSPSATDGAVGVLRDTSSFPDGVPVGVALTYVRIGNDLYAVTEVVDRTFLQYREERVIHAHAKDGATGDVDAASVSCSALSSSDSGEDVQPRNGAGSLFSTSFSDTPFSTLDAALEAIQNQHEVTARQQRRRLYHRRRAVSTMNFGDLSYSLAGSAPVRPGARRQEVHMCWRCLSAEAAVIFLPCGHYAVCEECAEVLADCCVCKTPILSSIVLLERKKPRRPVATPKQQHQPQ